MIYIQHILGTMPLVFPSLSGPLCPSLHLLLFSPPPPFLYHLLLPTRVTSHSFLFSSPSLLHNRCGCNGSQLERHDEAALETESETETESSPKWVLLSLRSHSQTRTHARERTHSFTRAKPSMRARTRAFPYTGTAGLPAWPVHPETNTSAKEMSTEPKQQFVFEAAESSAFWRALNKLSVASENGSATDSAPTNNTEKSHTEPGSGGA